MDDPELLPRGGRRNLVDFAVEEIAGKKSGNHVSLSFLLPFFPQNLQKQKDRGAFL
jgi:hypothetical protein